VIVSRARPDGKELKPGLPRRRRPPAQNLPTSRQVRIGQASGEDHGRDEDARSQRGGPQASFCPGQAGAGDIRFEEHCKALIDRAFDELGKLDILVNNAAYQMCQEKIEALSSEQFDRVFRTNVYAMFYLCRAALPRTKEGGAIINTTSI
jgi:NAD(P)-dependent dehydrogenase (short-subunit alcohol dehydrogenase family)